MINKLLEMLRKEFELSDQASEEIKKIVDEFIVHKECEIKENLERDLKDQFLIDFDEFVEETVAKLSTFLDEILKEELVIPENIKEWARVGQEYSEILEALKQKIQLEEGAIQEEVQAKINEANTKLEEYKNKLDKVMEDHLAVSHKLKEYEMKEYVREKCSEEALTKEEQEMVERLLDGILEQDEIDEKFAAVVTYVRGKGANDDDDKKANDKTNEDEEGKTEGKGKAMVNEDEDKSKNTISEQMNKFRELVFG